MIRKDMNLPMLGGDAMVRAESINETERTFEIVWTTGARVRRRRWLGEDYDEELVVTEDAIRMDRLNRGAPFLNTHNAWSLSSVLGSVVPGSVRIENGQGVATIKFSDAEEDESIWRKIVSGVIRNISVGYRVWKYEIEKREGEFEIRRAVDWEPYEISAVPIGADPNAQVREAPELNACVLDYRDAETADRPATEERKDDMTKKDTPSAGGNGGATTTEERTAEPAAPAATLETTPRSEDAIRAEAAQGERERLGVLDDLVARHALGDTFRKSHAEAGTSVDAIRAAAFEEMAKRDDEASGHSQLSEPARVVTDAQERFLEGAGNAIIVRAGQASVVQKSLKDDAPKIDAGEFRSFSMVDLARYYLELNGVRASFLSAEEIYRRTLLGRGGGAGYGAQGSGDFAVLLENVMHKVLLAAYQTTPDTWSRFCATGSVSDLREHNRFRTGSFGSLDALTQHGEYKNKSIPDGEKYAIKAATKGNIIALTRQAFIDDDLGAFSMLATMFGRAARLTIEMDVYALLAENNGLGPVLRDGKTLFHADHNNIVADAPISVDLFDDVDVLMGSQTDVSGNEILDLSPSVLLVAKGARGDASVINDAEYDPNAEGQLRKPNKVRGLFDDIVGTARMSGTRFYAFANPNVAPAIEVAFLNGQTEPFLASEEGWKTDGTEWKVRLDFGIAGQDFRGAITGSGAGGAP